MSVKIISHASDRDYKNHNRKNHDICTKMTDPKPKKILLKCGQNLEPARFDVDNPREQRFTLGRVIVDIGCLRKPEVKIEFSSTVFFQTRLQNSSLITGGTIQLDFRLRRSCDNGPLITVLNRTYRKELNFTTPIVEEITSSEAVSFSFCEKLDPSKCCEYVVEVSGIPGRPALFENIGIAEVNDLSLGAFAQEVDC